MRQNKLVIGITGGVGAGKSTVLSYISEKYGAKLILADSVGHELMAPGKSVFTALLANYGKEILGDDGEIDKKKLAELIFRNEESTKRANEIEHPLIKKEILRKISYSKKKLIFVEAALLKEGKLTEICDECWYIHADPAVRTARLMKSRGYTKEKCMQIMEKQMKREEYLSFCSVEILNNGDLTETYHMIDENMKRLGEQNT